MSYTYRLYPLVQDDYDEEYEWYESRQKGLGERFIKAVRKKIEEIILKPEVYANNDLATRNHKTNDSSLRHCIPQI